jgi:hypothetical protein
MNMLGQKVAILTTFCLLLHWQARSHIPGGGTGGGAFGGSGAGRSFSGVSIYSINDSAKIAFDFYGNLSYSLCADLNQGEPLGPGGRISNMYNTFLYQEYTSFNPYPYRSDFRLQQLDFGYTPVWQPNAISGRLQYRFLPTVWGTLTMDCNLDGLAVNIQNASSYIQIGALNVKWAPRLLKGFSTTIGKVHLGGTYITIFDQMPLENFLFNGLVCDYFRSCNNTIFLSGRIAAGQQFLGRTVSFSDTTGNKMTLFSNVEKIRNRNHIFAKAQFGYRRKFGAKLVGGYQIVPADSTQINYAGTTQPLTYTIYHPRSTGWHIGMELAFNTRRTNQIGIFAYGKNDVRMGWGSPSYINKPDNGGVSDWYDPNEQRPDFTMEGSALTYGVYWANLNFKRLMIDLGLSGVWQRPAKDVVTYSFYNAHWGLDSSGYWVLIEQIDTSAIQAQDFKTLKGAIKASYRIARNFRAGCRYDEIHFFNPEAHANVPELSWQMADPMDTTASTLKMLYNNPARWEREAINTRIVTPFLSFEIAKILRIRAAYACAFYDKPVYRQSKLSDWHGNFSLGATVTYRFAKLPD